jgi:hypothetical protein
LLSDALATDKTADTSLRLESVTSSRFSTDEAVAITCALPRKS